MYTKHQLFQLIKKFTAREVTSRYKNSYLGILWSFLSPILMLVVYSFVFTEVFQSKWNVGIDSKFNFAVMLFAALNTYQIFSESISKAPNLILNNQNYVKKVVFPLEILPLTMVLSSAIHSIFGYFILFVALLLIEHSLHWTTLYLPLILLPLVMFTTAVSYILAALGVFVRDIGHTIAIILSVLFFLTPIFYPISAVPEKFQFYMLLNPLTLFIEQARKILLTGQSPDWGILLILYGISIALYFVGYYFFKRCRRLFNDVL